MALYKHELALCPWCGGESGHRVDHIYKDRNLPTAFGPWNCNACGKYFRGTVTAPGDVTITRADDSGYRTRAMALLKRDTTDGPLFFVMEYTRSHDGKPEMVDFETSARFFYEEHSCPTNWLKDCVAVIEGGDCDPHGFLEFIRIIDVPMDFKEWDDNQWALLFPEILAGSTIDGTATESQGLLGNGQTAPAAGGGE